MKIDKYFNIKDKFKFLCHAGLKCFNSCCMDINIFLTPLDVLSLKNSVGIISKEFLNEYTIIIRKHQNVLPIPIIKMKGEEKRCPFVSEKGCRVYNARPWSCRMAPVDLINDSSYRMCFDSSFCLGLNEDVEWTIREWVLNQGIDLNNPLDIESGKLKNNIKFTGLRSLDVHIQNIFFMVCYDIDTFRKYIFETSFLKQFHVDDRTIERIKYDDQSLLGFGFKWLAEDFDIKKSIKVRDECFEDFSFFQNF